MSSSKIAVIGAGLAGITAARSLTAAGYNVQVFEKSRGSGGRLASKRSDMGRVNLGAQAFSTDDAQFLQELENWQQSGWVEGLAADPTLWTGAPYMSALTRNLLGHINTHFACEIRTLSHDDNGWSLHDQHQHVHGPFKQLVVAIPAPQAETLLEPCAPELAGQAGSVVMQPIWMVALGFKQPVHLKQPIDQLHNDAIAQVTLTPLSDDHPMQTLMLRATDSWSSAHLENEREQVIADLSASLASVLSEPLPVADSVFAHRWRYGLGALSQPSTLLADTQRGLYLAGDWCGKGDVYSAWRSGQHAAQQIISHQ